MTEQFVHLVGAEQVSNAAHTIQSAATDMRNAGSNMAEALQQHQRFLDDWLNRFEAVLTKLEPRVRVE